MEMQLGVTAKSQSGQYLNFLEKQVEKSQRVSQDVAVISDAVNDMGSRLDLLELGQQDLIKKFRILESIAMGSNDDQNMQKKTIEHIFLRVQELEARIPDALPQNSMNTSKLDKTSGNINEEQLHQRLDQALANMERKITDILTKDFEKIMHAREQVIESRITALIDAQAKDIAFDFTSLDQKLQELSEFVMQQTQRLTTSQSQENKDPNTLKTASLNVSNIEKALIDLKKELIEKADSKDIQGLKRQLRQELADFDKKLKTLSAPSISYDKDLKAMENRLTMKMTKAISRIGDIMKKQDRKLRGMIETSESRLQKQYSPLSNKSGRNRGMKSQHSLNISNNSMMRSLSPIKQEESRQEKSFSQGRLQALQQRAQQDYQSITTNESAFRKYQSQFKSESQRKSDKKYIRSGVKRVRGESLTTLSPNTQNAYKRTISQEQQASIVIENQRPNKEKSQPLRRRDPKSASTKRDKSAKSKIAEQPIGSKNQTLKASVNEFDTPNFDLNGISPERFSKEEHHSIRERYLNNLKEASTISLQASPDKAMAASHATNTSIDRQMQLKITNERLAKLEKMYEELSQLEERAKQSK